MVMAKKKMLMMMVVEYFCVKELCFGAYSSVSAVRATPERRRRRRRRRDTLRGGGEPKSLSAPTPALVSAQDTTTNREIQSKKVANLTKLSLQHIKVSAAVKA